MEKIERFNFNRLTAAQYNILKTKLYDTYSKTNIEVLKYITPDIFEEILTGDICLIIKYLSLFYHISLTQGVNIEHYSKLYKALIKSIPTDTIYKNFKRELIKDTIVNKSYGWSLEILLNEISREYLYSCNIFRAIYTSHNTEISEILINRIMKLYIGAHMKFNFKKMLYKDYKLSSNYLKFKNTNTLIGADE